LINLNFLPYIRKPNTPIILNFRKILLNICKTEFEEKCFIDIKPQETLSIERLSELETKRRERLVGNITFIGNLHIRNILKGKIIYFIIENLIYPSNGNELPRTESIEQGVRLLTKIGIYLEKGNEESSQKFLSYLAKLEQLTKEKSRNKNKICHTRSTRFTKISLDLKKARSRKTWHHSR